MKIFIRANGCQGRDLDRARLIKYFETNNCKIVSLAKTADYIIFITCSFKESRKIDSLVNIKKYKNYKGELIVVGCLPEIAPDEFKDNFSGKFVTTKTLEQIDDYFPDFKYKFNITNDANFLFPKLFDIFQKAMPEFKFNKNTYNQFIYSKVFSEGKQIPYLRIGNGCDEKCAYCGIRKAIGPLKSKSIDDIKNEYAQLLKKGYRRFNFFSDNLGAYGSDMNTSLSYLLNELATFHQNKCGSNREQRIEWALLHLHPLWMIRNKHEIIKRIEETVITKIMSPIQSGSERILKLMNRYANNQEILKTFHDFKSANTKLKLHSQVIIGFPSETEEDFMKTAQFIKDAKFDLILPFEYYDSPHTPAFDITPKINKEVIKSRMKRFGQMLDKAGIRWLTF